MTIDEKARTSPALPPRGIVSYVRRSSRMTRSQEKWIEEYSSRWVIPVDRGGSQTRIAAQPPLDLTAIFGRTAPLVIEIGSGHGDTLAHAAEERPAWDFLGFEVYEACVATTLGKLAAHHLDNVRLVVGDAVTGMTNLIPDQRVSEVWVFFPDPWQKKRNHKRRLISADFAHLVRSKLVDGGVLRLATDWDDYAHWMTRVMDAAIGFVQIPTERFSLRPVTKFEARGIDQSRTIHDLAYQKVQR